MDKSQLLYNTTPEFESNKDVLDLKRHYTAETLDNKYIHFKNYNIKPEDVIKPISESVAADICLVENNSLNKYIADGNSYSIDLFPLEQYTPIGVVVVPASHTDDGTARVMSLSAMDYNNPEVGSTDGHVGMAWGGLESDILMLPNLTKAPYIAEYVNKITAHTQTILGWDTVPLINMSSDYYTSYQNPYDTKSYYGGGGSISKAMPSPYLEDGTKNPIYHSTSNTASILANMDGKGNTEKILAVDNASDTSWQTAATITNTGTTETIHPAAQCCGRYHTVGTNQGDWYLPSAGELGYLASRWKAIDTSIKKIVSSGFEALVLPIDEHYWSSTEFEGGISVRLDFYNNYAVFGYNNLNNYYYVRAFCVV